MMAAIAAIMTSFGESYASKQQKIAALGPYKSRGKGRGGRQAAPHGAQMAGVRAARKTRNVKRYREACRGAA